MQIVTTENYLSFQNELKKAHEIKECITNNVKVFLTLSDNTIEVIARRVFLLQGSFVLAYQLEGSETFHLLGISLISEIKVGETLSNDLDEDLLEQFVDKQIFMAGSEHRVILKFFVDNNKVSDLLDQLRDETLMHLKNKILLKKSKNNCYLAFDMQLNNDLFSWLELLKEYLTFEILSPNLLRDSFYSREAQIPFC